MASRTQMRLQQLTGSINDLAYTGSISSAAQSEALAHTDLAQVLGQMAGTIGRITGKNSANGADSFTNAAAGTFYQTLVPGTDDSYDLGSSAAAWQDGYFEGDLILTDAGKLSAAAGLLTLESVDSDITFALAAGNDINIPSDIGMAFGGDSEKIEGNGTDLTLTAAADILLTATTDVVLPNNVGLVLGGLTEKVEGNGTNLAINSGADIAITAVNNLIIDVQGTDSNDGVDISLGADTSATKFIVRNNSGTSKFSVDGAGTATFANNVVIDGNLDINGTSTTIDSTNLLVQDSIIGLGVSGSGAFGNVGDRAIVFARSANAFDALPALNYDGLQFTLGKYLASPASASMGSADSKVDLEVKDLIAASIIAPSATHSSLTNNRVVIAGTGGVLEDDANFVFDGSDLSLGNNIGMIFGDAGEKIEGDGTDLTIASSALMNLTAGSAIVVPSAIPLRFADSGEYVSGDGTDLTMGSGAKINLTATSDVHIPQNIGLVFDADASEKIESDNTDLTISSGAKINLTATSDVHIPQNIGLVFDADASEKIESNNTDLTISSGAKINLTATSDVHLPNNIGMVFGDAGEKIEGDGSKLTIIAANLDLTMEAGGDVVLPNNIGMVFGDAGEKIEGDGTDLAIASSNALLVDASALIAMTSPYIEVGNASTNEARIRLLEDGSNGANYITFGSPAALSGNHTFTLPDGNGTDGFALTTDGSGVTSWSAISAAATMEKVVMSVATDQRLVAGTALDPASATVSNVAPYSRAALDLSGVVASNLDKLVDVFVNGQMLTSGSEANRAAGTVDYVVSAHTSTSQIKFAFDLEMDDVIVVQKKG